MEKSTVRLKVANISDIGRNPARTKNEDYFGHYEGEYGNLFLVCDGMGGHEAGEVASRLAVEAIKNYFSTNYLPGEENVIIGQAIDHAQQKIIEESQNNPELAGMGTTLVLLLINGSSFWYAHSGDSRIYLSRGGAINQLTKDHSEVQQMVDSGIITQEQAADHPRRNFITKALGHTLYAPDIAGPSILRQDDVFLLCSDGLTEYVRDEELLQQMEEEPQIACRNLVEMANDRGGSDNITIQIVQVLQCSPFSVDQTVPLPRRKHFTPPLTLVLTIAVFIGAVVWYALGINARKDGAPKKAAKVEEEVKIPKRLGKKDAKKPAPAAKQESAPAPAEQTALLAAIDKKLDAREPSKDFQTFFQSIATGKGQARTLKFFNSDQGDKVVFIVPGQAIYLNYNKLANDKNYNVNKEHQFAILTLAVLQSGKKPALTQANWEKDLFAAGSEDLLKDANLAKEAIELYQKSSSDQKPAENAAGLFGFRSDAYGKHLKAGAYNFSYVK